MNTATVDRIEGDKVVLISEDRNIVKRLSDFEEHVREGDVVDLETLKILDEETKDRKNEVRDLLGKIF